MKTALTIPDLDEAIEEKLRARAGRHGHSVEAEAREILIQAVTQIVEPPAGTIAAAPRQAFLDLAGALDGVPDLSRRRGFEV